MTAATSLPLLTAALLLAACDRPAIDPSQSLVGASSFPTASELNRELITLYYHQDKSLTRQLSYELTPDDRWAIVIAERDTGRELKRQTIPLSGRQAASLREQLWRLRPEQLDGLENLHNPADCPPQPTDTMSAVTVAFIREGPKAGVADDKIGIFDLPDARYCNTPKGNAAHRLIENLMRAMPGQELRKQFAYWPPLG